MDEKVEYSLVIAIVNSGNTDLVMEGARNAGARGGTTLRARGTGNIELEKFYGIPIQSEKEMVLIIVNDDITEKVMESIYKAAGLETPGHGIVFSQKIDNVIGLSAIDLTKENIEEN